jgi:FixJ family two-component response regulator
VTFAPELKVVFLSGYPDIVLSKYGELKPGINFIQKPFEPEILVEKIQSLLN